MLWNTFEQDLPNLDRYHNPKFEPGSGVSDRKVILAKLQEIADRDLNRPHSYAMADVLTYLFTECAIEVRSCDWFGINLAGWAPDRKERYSRPTDSLADRWLIEAHQKYDDGPETNILKKDLCKAGALWAYPDVCHSKPNWEDILGLGLKGLLNRVKKYRDEKIAAGTYTDEMAAYYEPVAQTYEAFLVLMRRLTDAAKSKLHENEKMPYVAAALEKLCDNPPETFYEVLLLTYIYTLIQEYISGIQTRTLGNVDMIWRPYYEKALADGSLTRDNAKELMKYFYMQYEMAGHPHGQPMHVGGTAPDGSSNINDLSYVLMEAYEELNIISPKIQIAVSKNMPDKFLRKCCDMIRNGHTSIAFCNEEIGRESQKFFSPDEKDLHSLALSGCYNFSLLENLQCESVGTNFPKALELALNNGTDPLTGMFIGLKTGEAEEFTDFASFHAAFYTQWYHLIDQLIRISDFFDAHLNEIMPSLLLSANYEHSVSQGKDYYYNGSKYRNPVITVSCPATAVDSLYVIQKYVFDRKEISLAELRDALRANWVGYEELQKKIINDPEKYGNNLDQVDWLMTDLMNKTGSYILSKRTPYGAPYAPDGEGITHGITFGRKIGATPDGRFAGEQLSKNLQAGFGRDTRGVTAYLNSVTKIDATEYPNGAPIDFILHPSAAQGEEGLAVMTALVRTTFAKGGAAVQGNVYNAQILRAAQAEPDKYKGLQVRLCGWSQYFNRLTKDEQDMLIRQAETAS